MVVMNYGDYGCFDYPSECAELSGFQLGEVVYDEFGDIGIILALYKNGKVRTDSNGMMCIKNIKKCPENTASEEMKRRSPIRPCYSYNKYVELCLNKYSKP